MNKLTTALAVLCAVFLVAALAKEREAEGAHARADSLATANAATEARAQGWRVKLTETSQDWQTKLAGRDSTIAQLERTLTAARARLTHYTRIAATAQGTTTVAASVDTTAADTTTRRTAREPAVVTRSVTSEPFADGPLSGQVALHFGRPVALPRRGLRPQFTLDWRTDIELESTHSYTADGRCFVATRAKDPRVHVSVPELACSPEAEPETGGWPWEWAAGGFVVGVVLMLAAP